MALKTEQDYRLTIKPALRPEERHEIEKALQKLGYKIHGGGTDTDMSQCDISFVGAKRLNRIVFKMIINVIQKSVSKGERWVTTSISTTGTASRRMKRNISGPANSMWTG